MTTNPSKSKASGTKLTGSAALAALARLKEQSLLAGKDTQRLETIARSLDAHSLQCSLDNAWSTLFENLEPVNAETALRKLKQRLKETQQEAISTGHMQSHQLLELEVTKKSGNAPRYLWFTGPAGTTAQARTPDLESIPAPAIQETTALPPELLGNASPGSEPILILTINDHETRAVRDVFSPKQPPRHFLREERVYEWLGNAGRRPVIGYRCRMGSMSAGAALSTTINAIRDHKPAAILGVGIAFGNKSKNQKLGDVLVATEVRNYEAERVNPDASHAWRGDQIPTAPKWVTRATQFEPSSFKLHKGLVLSGEKLVDNEATLEMLFHHFPTAVGGDMEGVGLMTACHEGKVDWVVIKAVSDWGDGQKSSIGESTKDQHQLTAARHAAAVAYAAIHLRWPVIESQDLESARRPSTNKTSNAQEEDTSSSPPRVLQNIEAKTPDFKALDALLGNQGRTHAMGERLSQGGSSAKENAPTIAAHESLINWLQTPDAPPVFALLGEYGMGKTITCQRLYHDLRLRRTSTNPPAWAREPLYFDLRNLSLFKNRERTQTVDMPDKAALINDLIKHGWRIAPGSPAPSFTDVHALLTQGALVILDGLDECLVHLVDAQHPAFIRSLMELITDADPDGTAGTRLLLSCRTNFFKTLDDQINFFTGQHRGKVDGQWYRSMVLQPFSEAQIRQYLEQVVPDVPAERLMNLVQNTHNLSELAERPMTLKLIGSQIQELEAMRARGERINGARLYELVAKSWLERDEGKHHLQPEHKMRLMPDLAAHLWRIGARSLPYDELHRWFHAWRQQQPELTERYGPAVYNQNKLEEDLRTATFVVREDQAADQPEGFRFAHSSLQEFFLAKHLAEAVVHDQPERWAIDMPSQETLNFLENLLEIEQHTRSRQQRGAPDLIDALNHWRKTYRAQASELLLKLALNTRSEGPRPLLAGFNLQGAQLRGWTFGTARTDPGVALLPMQGVNFDGADLRDAKFDYVRLDGCNFSSARMDRAALQHCSLKRATLVSTIATGTVIRRCNLEFVDLSALGDAYRLQVVACVPQDGLAPPTRGMCPPDQQRHPTGVPRLAWLPMLRAMDSRVTFSPDGTRVAIAGSVSAPNVIDAKTGEVLFILAGYSGQVAYSPDGKFLAAIPFQTGLHLLSPQSGRILLNLDTRGRKVRGIAFSLDSSRIAATGQAPTVWNLRTIPPTLIYSSEDGAGYEVVFSPDGTQLAAGRGYGGCLWDLSSGKEIWTSPHYGRTMSRVAISPKGDLAAVVGNKGVALLNAATGKELFSIESPKYPSASRLAFSPDGHRIAYGGWPDDCLCVADVATGENLLTMWGHSQQIEGIDFSKDGRLIASSSRDQTLRVWDAITGTELMTVEGGATQRAPIMSFSSDGSRIASVMENTIHLWDAKSGQAGPTSCGRVLSSKSVCLIGGDSAIATTLPNGTVQIWNITKGEVSVELKGHTGEVSEMACSADGTRIVTHSGADQTIRLWSGSDGSAAWSRACERRDSASHLSMSADGTRIALFYNGRLNVWGAAQGESTWIGKAYGSTKASTAFSPDGLQMIVADNLGHIFILDTLDGTKIKTFKQPLGEIRCLAYSTDGLRIASGSLDGTLYVWDVATGAKLLEVREHLDGIEQVTFSPDGHQIASTSTDGTLRLWSAADGRCLRVHWAGVLAGRKSHAVWVPPGVEDESPGGRVISASGDVWRQLAWQAWDYPGAPGEWTRLPLGAYPGELPGI